MKGRKAFTLIELMIASAVLAVLFAATGAFLIPQIERAKKNKTEELLNQLGKALDFHYETALSYRRNHSNWVNQPDCSRDRSWLVPPGCWNYSDVMVLWKDDTNPSRSQILKTFQDLGCKLVNNGAGYDVVCYDGWGRPFHYSYENGGKTHSVPYDFRAGSPIKIKIISAGKDGIYGNSDDITYTWSSANLDEKYRQLTYDRLQAIADALDAYFRQRFSVEVTERTYPSGLAQEDDLKVDWYVQLCSSKPYDYCTDSTCSNLRSVWPSVTCNGSVTYSTCSIDTILSHLNVSTDYKVDAFGNPVYVNLCYDPDGDGWPKGYAPSTPARDRGAFSASVSDGFITVMSTCE